MQVLVSLLVALSMLGAFADGGKSKKSSSVKGEFRSVRGVMNELSCHCGDGGYVTTANGDEIAVCFSDKNPGPERGEKASCDRIEVWGTYKTSSRTSGENDPCPNGTMRILQVSKYKCL